MIPLFWPAYNGKDLQQEFKKLFPIDGSNRWLGQGDKVKEFESEFGKKFGYKNCLGLNSGSAALELAYHLLDLKKGDEVIYPVLTCTASGIPLLRNNIKIVFADIKKDTFTIDPVDVEKKINKNTKAILAVTLGGLPIDNKIYELSQQYNIPLIIDAAQSVGVPETFGDYICYSFQAIKHFTTGDGGMLICKDDKDHERAKKLRWFGIDREAKIANDWQPYKKREMTMNIEEAGYKFHMNDISATIGLSGLKHSDEYLKHRKTIADIYTSKLRCKTISGGANWLYGIMVDNRDHIASVLKDSGVETNMAHLRNDIFTVFGGTRKNLPNMNEVEDKYLYIPINTKVTKKDAEYISDIINAVL